MLTTEQLVKQTKTSKVTIFGYVKRGLMPGPAHIYTDPQGRGRKAYWHPSALTAIYALREVSGRGVPAEAVKARIDQESFAGSSISSDRALQVVERWRQPFTGGELATKLGLPLECSRAHVFAFGVAKIAASLQLHDTTREIIHAAAYNSLPTAIHNFMLGIPSVLVFSGQRARVVARWAMDCYQRGDWDALGSLLPAGEFESGDGKMRFEWRADQPGVTDDGWIGASIVSIEITALLRDLWEWYDESATPEFTLSRGYAVTEHATDGLLVEYDYTPMSSGFGDMGSTIRLEPTSARRSFRNRPEMSTGAVVDAIVPPTSAVLVTPPARKKARGDARRKRATRTKRA